MVKKHISFWRRSFKGLVTGAEVLVVVALLVTGLAVWLKWLWQALVFFVNEITNL